MSVMPLKIIVPCHPQFLLAPSKCLLSDHSPHLKNLCLKLVFLVLWKPQQDSWISPVSFQVVFMFLSFSWVMPMKVAVISLSLTKVPRTSLSPPWEKEKQHRAANRQVHHCPLGGICPLQPLKLWPQPSPTAVSGCVQFFSVRCKWGFWFLLLTPGSQLFLDIVQVHASVPLHNLISMLGCPSSPFKFSKPSLMTSEANWSIF